MWFSLTAVERAMKVRDVIARAVSHEYTWLQAAEIIGVTPRTMRALEGAVRTDPFL